MGKLADAAVAKLDAERAETLLVLHDVATGAMAHLQRFIETAMALGAAFRQEFPSDCVLMRNGQPTRSFEEYVMR